MKVAGLIWLYDFPLWRTSLLNMLRVCDEVYVWFDGKHGDTEILAGVTADARCFDKIKGVLVSDLEWGTADKLGPFHDEALRMLDGVKPDIVALWSQDETYGDVDLYKQDLVDLFHSDKDALMVHCDYPMPVDHGEPPFRGRPYPPCPHMRAYKWKPGLTYIPYQGYCRVTNYADPKHHMMAKAKYTHWCMFTKEMRDSKLAWLKKYYAELYNHLTMEGGPYDVQPR